MSKLIYNKELNQYEVWSDAVEGAQRNKEATTTEEYVIKTILEQDKIMKSIKQFDIRLKILEDNIKRNINKEIGWLYDKIHTWFIAIKQLEKVEKKWWQFWKH